MALPCPNLFVSCAQHVLYSFESLASRSAQACGGDWPSHGPSVLRRHQDWQILEQIRSFAYCGLPYGEQVSKLPESSR